MAHEPNEEQIRGIIKKHFSNWEIKDIKRINEGYTHYMYECVCEIKNKVINFILRIGFNKKDFSIAKELWVMKKYSEIGILAPKVYGSDVSRTEFPFDYVIMEKINGECLGKIWNNLNKKDKAEIAFLMGKLLAKLHSIRLDKFGRIDENGIIEEEEFSFRKIPNAPLEPEWTTKLLSDTLKDFASIISFKLLTPKQSSDILHYLHSNIYLTENAEPVLIHSDFHLDHIFVIKENGEWKITGICDFEFASSSAKEFDFVKIHRLGLLNDENFKKMLLKGYGIEKLHKEFDKVVKLYRIARDIGFAKYTARRGDMEITSKTISNILDLIRESK